MRIAILIPALSDGGAQIQCLRLMEQLATRAGVVLCLIYFNDGVHSAKLRPDLYQVVKLSSGSQFKPGNLIETARAIRAFRPDIIFSWLHAADVYAFVMRRLFPRLRWLMTERDSAYPRKLRFQLREKIGRHADAIVANSAAGGLYWERLGATCPIHVVPNIVAPAARAGGEEGRGAILSVGRLEPQKNPLSVARAFAAVAARQPGLAFSFVGEGACRGEIEQIIAQSGAGGGIALLGFRADAPALIGAARLMVTLSHHEGTPNVLLEAVAADVPVVASDIPEHRAVLGDEYPYLVAERTDPAAAAGVIERALAAAPDPALYAFARQRLAEMSGPAIADRYLAIFDTLLAARGRRAG